MRCLLLSSFLILMISSLSRRFSFCISSNNISATIFFMQRNIIKEKYNSLSIHSQFQDFHSETNLNSLAKIKIMYNNFMNMEERFSPLTLDEENILLQNPKKIITRELTSLSWKIRYVILMLPQHRQQSINYLRKWDLWGPMLICLFFAIPMSIVNQDPLYEQDFINVFLIFWIGSLLVSINCKLLGSKGSLLLIVSTVGYCLVPLALIGLFTSILHSVLNGLVKFIILVFGLSWSCMSCMLIMRDLVSQQRKWLCTYPIFLFYVFLAWFAIVA